jgi:hypothetical protein
MYYIFFFESNIYIVIERLFFLLNADSMFWFKGSVSVWDISSFHLNNKPLSLLGSSGPQLTMLPIITWNEVHKATQIKRTGVVTDGVRDMQISGQYLYTCGVDGRLFQRRMIRVYKDQK